MLYPNIENVPFMSMILIEPALLDRSLFVSRPDDRAKLEKLIRMVQSHRNEWESHDTAYEWCVRNYPWRTWDPRVVRLYAVRLFPLLPSDL